jgi:hypothetical protein
VLLTNPSERLDVEAGHLGVSWNWRETESIAVDAPPTHEYLSPLNRNPGVPDEADVLALYLVGTGSSASLLAANVEAAMLELDRPRSA